MIKLFTILVFLSVITYSQDFSAYHAEESNRVIMQADKLINDDPVTITAFIAKNSSGGLHDYYSDSDYWWPDSTNPNGPYIRRDGFSNPNNFVAHRHVLIDMSVKVAALTAAYKVSKKSIYSDAAYKHIHAWFIAESTRMNPHLAFAQAVKGRATGRGVGIIDTIHLIEVVRSIEILYADGRITEQDFRVIVAWFQQYLNWLFTHPNGIEEQNAKNNHGTCYTMQVAAFAHLTKDDILTKWCKDRLFNTLLPIQMAENGSFPLELARTKPYSYSIFNLDAMVMVTKILSLSYPEIWNMKDSSGRNVGNGIEFLYPYLKNKSSWPFPQDVEYFNDFPVRQTSLLFCGLAYKNQNYLELWHSLTAEPTVREVIRNCPIRQPLLWIN